MTKSSYTVALIGNPNVGKSVIFNCLVPGARQHVGNWPGKTVEKKEGHFTHKGVQLMIVDLPGTYSLTAAAEDELVSRNYIIEEKPDLVVDVVDASNLERNLYLAMLLLELDANVLLVLNMADVAQDKGYLINIGNLSERLGIPVIATVATKGRGIVELKDAMLNAAGNPAQNRHMITYGHGIERVIDHLVSVLEKDCAISKRYPLRWLAIRLLEGDAQALSLVKESGYAKELMEVIS